MPAVRSFIARRRKAIAGVLAVGLVYAARRWFGLTITQDQALLLTAGLVGLLVHQARNA